MAKVVPITAQLRVDITLWARRAGWTPQRGIDDPDSILDFFDWCLANAPRWSHPHGSEIFRWVSETAGDPPGRSAAVMACTVPVDISR